MSEQGLAETLRRIANQASPVRLPADLWHRGRGRRRRRLIAAVAAVVLAGTLAVPLLLHRGDAGALPPTSPGPAVPATVYPPVPGESTVLSAPPGPGAILVSGVGAFEGTDAPWYHYESRSLLVGRGGAYRLVREEFGPEIVLSPDGRYLAGTSMLEGTGWFEHNDPAVLDLTTGKIRRYQGGRPLAWAPTNAPDASASSAPAAYLLLWHHEDHVLRLLDLASGRTRDLMPIGGDAPRISAAFSPDGSQLAIQADDTLYIIDVAAGTHRKLVDFGTRERLAGAGAWLPDNRTLAMLEMSGCETDCDTAALNARVYHIRYLETVGGTRVDGPRLDGVVGIGAELHGWQDNGDAVVTRHDGRDGVHNGPIRATWVGTEMDVVRDVEVLALHSGGGQTRLVDLPDDARRVDIPQDLIRAGAFGGPAPSRVEGVAREAYASTTWLVIPAFPLTAVLLLALAGVLLAIAVRVRRRRRTRAA